MEEQERLNLEVTKLNKELLEHNKRVTLQNEQMAIREHSKKMELFELERLKLINQLSREVEPLALTQVAEFHNTFGHPIETEPTLPSYERQGLRVSLIKEELRELEVGIANGDLVEVVDALADLQYVLSGTILEFGLGSKFKSIFEEVHRSNMSKSCTTREEAEKTVTFYEEKGSPCEIVSKDIDKHIVYRKSDGKILKSINYSPANLSKLL